MKKEFEKSPLYRFFNVVLFVMYVLVFILIIIAAYLGYGEREILSASVDCADGTSWNALEPKNILYDTYALCGICTKRNTTGTQFTDCNLGEVDFDSFETKIVKESWSWSTAIYPLITLVVGLCVVDFLKLTVIYIFSGRVAFDKSLLLRIIVFLFDSVTQD